jgi:hypothetical protein
MGYPPAGGGSGAQPAGMSSGIITFFNLFFVVVVF